MKPKSIEFIAFDKYQNVQYKGICKIKINRLSSMLLVEFVNEDYKTISAMLKWDFIMDTNILFVFDEQKSNNFSLIFDDEYRCKKVYDFILKDKLKCNIPKAVIYQQFWIPLCNKISKNYDTHFELKKIIKQWIENQENDEKNHFFKFLKENNYLDVVYCIRKMTDQLGSHISGNMKEKRINLQKRRRSEMKKCIINLPKKEQSKKFPKIIDQSLYKIVNIKQGKHLRRRLLIFISIEKKCCYEFAWSGGRNIYYCIGCRAKGENRITAILDKNENGIECIKMKAKKHICNGISYIYENYIEMKIFKKPYYEILENCNRATGKVIILFDENDKSHCWEFYTGKTHIRCYSCQTPAKLWYKNTEKEYFELRNANHQCKTRPYLLENYYAFNDFVLSPNFEIQTMVKNGKEKKMLIIFDKSNRNLCHVYTVYRNKCYCQPCKTKNVSVSAKLLKNSDGEDFVILSKTKHLCEKRPYENILKKDVILSKDDFKIFEHDVTGVKKLFIFDCNDRKLCYKFYQNSKAHEIYRCNGCENIRLNSDKKERSGTLIRAELFKEKEEYFVRLTASKHICKALNFKFEAEKYKKKEIPKCYNYFFYRDKKFPNAVNVALRHPEDASLCFGFNYNKIQARFVCGRCRQIKKSFCIGLEKDDDAQEYFNHDIKKHACKPYKISSICAPKYVILKRQDLNLEKKTMKNDDFVNEGKIVISQNFELQISKKGFQDGTLFIFHSEDRKTAYKLYYSNFDRKYFCCGLFDKSFRCKAFAQLQIGKNGEKCVILGPIEHKCAPVKYESEGKFISASEFVVVPEDKNSNKKAMIYVFTSPGREECYEFRSTTTKNTYYCVGCKVIKKYVTTKYCKNEKGQQFLQMSKQKEHGCVPKKFVIKKLEPKIIQNDLYELHANSRGEENKKLIIFTSGKREYVYEYCGIYKRSFTCVACLALKKSVKAKLVEDDKNGLKFLECGSEEHICQPQKYDPTKYIYVKPKTLTNDYFEFHSGKNGEKEKYLVVFISELKDFAYYFYMKQPGTYICSACCNKKHFKYVIAKVFQDQNGCKTVQLGPREHVCQPQKYDPNKFKI